MTDEGVRGFLVEKGMPGFTTRDILKKFSLRASITSELFFRTCACRTRTVCRAPRAWAVRCPA